MRKQVKTRHLRELHQITKRLENLLDEEDVLYTSKKWNKRKRRLIASLEGWLIKYTDYRLMGDNIILIGGLAEIYMSKTDNADLLKRKARRALKAVEEGKDLEDRGWKPFPELLAMRA